LLYHEIVSPVDPKKPSKTIITLDHFEEQMRFLKENGYQTLSIDELKEVLQGRKQAPSKAVVITLDDGFTNALQAVPIFERYGFKASFWIITGRVTGGAYMDWGQIEALDRHPLFEIGSHSVSHPRLTLWIADKAEGRGESAVLTELRESKRVLEEHLGRPVRSFAWPYGAYNKRLIRLARGSGYEVLFTTKPGLNYPGQDVLRIHRTVVDGASDLETFKARLHE